MFFLSVHDHCCGAVALFYIPLLEGASGAEIHLWGPNLLQSLTNWAENIQNSVITHVPGIADVNHFNICKYYAKHLVN